MNKTLLIGASGQIGKMATSLFVENSIPLVAMVRNRDKAHGLASHGVEIAEGDLEQDFGSVFQGCSRVVFCAGSGAGTSSDKTLLIDLWGACKAIDYAKEYGTCHFIMVSSRGADNPENGPAAIKPYLIAKHFADNYLLESGLNYTILRPGRLTNESGTGLVQTTRPSDETEQVISRADTTSAIYFCLLNNCTFGKIYELYKGTIPLDKALFSHT